MSVDALSWAFRDPDAKTARLLTSEPLPPHRVRVPGGSSLPIWRRCRSLLAGSAAPMEALTYFVKPLSATPPGR